MTPKSISDRIEHRFTALFPSSVLKDHAEAVGAIERNSKVQIPVSCDGLGIYVFHEIVPLFALNNIKTFAKTL